MNFKTLKEKYIELVAEKLSISVEDLSADELKIIDFTFDILEDRLRDMKALEDENYRLNIENKNLKAFTKSFEDDWKNED